MGNKSVTGIMGVLVAIATLFTAIRGDIRSGEFPRRLIETLVAWDVYDKKFVLNSYSLGVWIGLIGPALIKAIFRAFLGRLPTLGVKGWGI